MPEIKAPESFDQAIIRLRRSLTEMLQEGMSHEIGLQVMRLLDGAVAEEAITEREAA